MTDLSRRTALVVIASSAGTAFEWYDFFVFGTLASIIARQFTGGNQTFGYIFTLGAFAAGFFVRPFGAIFFGHMGDRFGRKRAFVHTIVLMGISTAVIGLLPGFRSVGVVAPILLVLTRMVQGFAMGGEYGGAAVYVAEHAHPKRRGFLTSWIQTTAAAGLVLASGVVLAVRLTTGERAFDEWGWRIPFLFSAVLLMFSLWLRSKLGESPEYLRMRSQGVAARVPLLQALQGENLRRVVLALVCVLLAQGAVWYTGHFYAQFFIERVLKVDARLVNVLFMIAVVLSAPGYVFCGWLSDRVGRKPVMLVGMGLMLLLYFPGFHALTAQANPALRRAALAAPVVVAAVRHTCQFEFNLLGHTANSACDVLRTTLADRGVPYKFVETSTAESASAFIAGAEAVTGTLAGLDASQQRQEIKRIALSLSAALEVAGYPSHADRSSMNLPLIVGLLLAFMLASTALYGPQAAALVELFPTAIRYTAVSISYNIGTGWVGGLLPVSAFALVAATGDNYSGLFYPFFFTSVSLVCCWLWFPETAGAALHSNGGNDVK